MQATFPWEKRETSVTDPLSDAKREKKRAEKWVSGDARQREENVSWRSRRAIQQQEGVRGRSCSGSGGKLEKKRVYGPPAGGKDVGSKSGVVKKKAVVGACCERGKKA